MQRHVAMFTKRGEERWTPATRLERVSTSQVINEEEQKWSRDVDEGTLFELQ